MFKEKIQQQFEKYPDLHILFYFDEEGVYENEIAKLELSGIRIVKFDNNAFNLKVKLNGEWLEEKVFLYVKQKPPRDNNGYKDFALLDLLVANKELMLDDIAEFMEEYQLQRHHRSTVSQYMKELKYISTRKILEPVLSPDRFDDKVLVRGLFSTFVRLTEIEQWDTIIAKLLTYSLDDNEENFKRFKKKVKDNNLTEVLQNKISEYFGPIELQLTQDELISLLLKLKYNAILQQLGRSHETDPYSELKISDTRRLATMNTLLETGLNNEKIKNDFTEAINRLTKNISEDRLLEIYGPDADYAYLPENMLWSLLRYHANNVGIQPEQTLAGLERIGLHSSTTQYFKPVLSFYTYLADMLMQLNDIKTYIFDKPAEYLTSYTQEYYRIDQSYRKAVFSYHKIDTTELPQGFTLENSKALLEHQYEGYSQALNREWLKCMNEFDFDYSSLPFPKQYDFYKHEISPVDKKVAVIISDALRYEAAESLLNELHADSKNKADIRYMVASVPSKTNVGMSNLLPGRQYEFLGNDIKVDGLSTKGSDNREKLLKLTEKNAITTTLNIIKTNKEAENRDIFKNKVVYIYHDIIDSIGDKRASEGRTFEAVEDAINEIKTEVKKLHSSFNVSRVLITADHGFIYNDKVIEDKDKENPTGIESAISHNRFEILKENVDNSFSYCFPLSRTTLFKEDYFVIIPTSVNRYRKQGVGHQFVHGGGSLQELVVPVIESARKRVEITKKVSPVLVNTKLKILSNVIRIQLLQEKKVSRFEKERDVIAGIYKGNEMVSNAFEATLDSTSDLPSERNYRFNLTLLASSGSESVLKLKIFDKSDMLNPLIEENVINQTLIESDF